VVGLQAYLRGLIANSIATMDMVQIKKLNKFNKTVVVTYLLLYVNKQTVRLSLCSHQ